MGVALLVSDHADPDVPWAIAALGHWSGSPFTIYRNPSALPRAYVVSRAHPSPSDEEDVAQFRKVDPRSAVLMAADPLGSDGPRQPFTPAEYRADDPDRPTIRVATEAPGLLVVADTWMPGWSATVDGAPAPVLRGDHAHRVIPLPSPGDHVVVMNYRPTGLAAGMAATGASGMIWLVLLGVHRFRPTAAHGIGRGFTTKARRAQRGTRREMILRIFYVSFVPLW
jgi:hypothetical protein